jgi:hypothetical protein
VGARWVIRELASGARHAGATAGSPAPAARPDGGAPGSARRRPAGRTSCRRRAPPPVSARHPAGPPTLTVLSGPTKEMSYESVVFLQCSGTCAAARRGGGGGGGGGAPGGRGGASCRWARQRLGRLLLPFCALPVRFWAQGAGNRPFTRETLRETQRRAPPRRELRARRRRARSWPLCCSGRPWEQASQPSSQLVYCCQRARSSYPTKTGLPNRVGLSSMPIFTSNTAIADARHGMILLV